MKDNEHDYFHCTIVEESLKAYCMMLHHDGSDHWIPKSLCEFRPEQDKAIRGVLEIESWFAEKEGMND